MENIVIFSPERKPLRPSGYPIQDIVATLQKAFDVRASNYTGRGAKVIFVKDGIAYDLEVKPLGPVSPESA